MKKEVEEKGSIQQEKEEVQTEISFDSQYVPEHFEELKNNPEELKNYLTEANEIV